jgi:hypothetical protein
MEEAQVVKKKKMFSVVSRHLTPTLPTFAEKTKAKLGHSVLWDTLYLQTSFVFLKVRVNS